MSVLIPFAASIRETLTLHVNEVVNQIEQNQHAWQTQLKQLQSQCVNFEACVSGYKKQVDTLLGDIHVLERKKRTLEDELQHEKAECAAWQAKCITFKQRSGQMKGMLKQFTCLASTMAKNYDFLLRSPGRRSSIGAPLTPMHRSGEAIADFGAVSMADHQQDCEKVTEVLAPHSLPPCDSSRRRAPSVSDGLEDEDQTTPDVLFAFRRLSEMVTDGLELSPESPANPSGIATPGALSRCSPVHSNTPEGIVARTKRRRRNNSQTLSIRADGPDDEDWPPSSCSPHTAVSPASGGGPMAVCSSAGGSGDEGTVGLAVEDRANFDASLTGSCGGTADLLCDDLMDVHELPMDSPQRHNVSDLFCPPMTPSDAAGTPRCRGNVLQRNEEGIHEAEGSVYEDGETLSFHKCGTPPANGLPVSSQETAGKHPGTPKAQSIAQINTLPKRTGRVSVVLMTPPTPPPKRKWLRTIPEAAVNAKDSCQRATRRRTSCVTNVTTPPTPISPGRMYDEDGSDASPGNDGRTPPRLPHEEVSVEDSPLMPSGGFKSPKVLLSSAQMTIVALPTHQCHEVVQYSERSVMSPVRAPQRRPSFERVSEPCNSSGAIRAPQADLSGAKEAADSSLRAVGKRCLTTARPNVREVVRDPSERVRMDAFACSECRSWYAAVGQMPSSCQHALLKKTGKHRFHRPPTLTPADYWNAEFTFPNDPD